MEASDMCRSAHGTGTDVPWLVEMRKALMPITLQ